ncbi:MAG: hypothetical protein JF615_06845 [Asticcacaulis sp.]|nr:hypothetical protein [Asticcacaulis sp.]
MLRGNSGSNLIDGMAGADIMIGGAGNDTYIVDNVGDVISEVAGGVDAGGNDLVSASVSHTLGLFIERLTLTGAANISGTGNAMDNAIIGNSGSNRIDGGLGADTMGGGRATIPTSSTTPAMPSANIPTRGSIRSSRPCRSISAPSISRT